MRVKCPVHEHNTMSPARAWTRTAHSRVERINQEPTVPPMLLISRCKKLMMQAQTQDFLIGAGWYSRPLKYALINYYKLSNVSPQIWRFWWLWLLRKGVASHPIHPPWIRPWMMVSLFHGLVSWKKCSNMKQVQRKIVKQYLHNLTYLKCPYHQKKFFLSDSISHPMNFCERKIWFG